MPNPARTTTAGRVYNDLRNLAKRSKRSTDELMIEYVLERFLYRVAVSPLGGRHLVLKGGLLLAQFGARRMTRDIDILGRAFPADEGEVIRRVAAIAAVDIDDGVIFDPSTVKTTPIREEDEYHGLRLVMGATLARARLKLQLDLSFGDPITPDPQVIDYPQQLSTESFQIFGYPLATVIAEKLSTAVALGDFNTRDRDYADLFRLISLHDLDGGELTAALNATAEHRGISLKPLSTSISDLAGRRQSSYAAWRRRQGSAASGYPERFIHALDLVRTFADPLLSGEVALRRWIAGKGTWS